MLSVIIRILEIIAIFWLIRFLLKNVLGQWFGTQSFGSSKTEGRFDSRSDSSPQVIKGEMKRDPQCGTFVSTELSIRSRFRNEELHFCSRQCQEEFLRAHSGPAA